MMDIKIYQINNARDKDNVKFMSMDRLPRLQGTTSVNSWIYDKVYEGQVDAKNLEDVYYIFNQAHPQDYRGHSLSVSDVVEVVSESRSSFYFCDSIGFKRISFEPAKTISALPVNEQTRPQKISLWARLGVSISATPEDLEILKAGGPNAKNKLLELVRSDKCVLDGETYFPGMANEKYFQEDIEFNIGPYSLHEKTATQTPAVEEAPLESSEFELPTPEAKVYMCAGSVRREIYEGTYDECLTFCEDNRWEFLDENEFCWSLDLDDLRELDSPDIPGENAPGKATEEATQKDSIFTQLDNASLIEYKGIVFDEFTVDKEAGSVWAEMCEHCAAKHMDVLFDELSEGGIGACSVQGCDIVGMDADTKHHYYVDFKPELIKVVGTREMAESQVKVPLDDQIQSAGNRSSSQQPQTKGKESDLDIS